MIAVVDEVESFAVARSEASPGANPVDVHRATDAVLDGLDRLAREAPNVILIATTNFPSGVDAAFRSRADRVFEFPLPNKAAIRAILADTLDALRVAYPKMSPVTGSVLDQVAHLLQGLDGRAVRKFVLEALASDPDVAVEPNRLRGTHLIAAARAVAADPKRGTEETIAALIDLIAQALPAIVALLGIRAPGEPQGEGRCPRPREGAPPRIRAVS